VTDNSEPVFRNYKGLISFTDPAAFDEYVQDIIRSIERYFPCMIEPVGSGNLAHQRFLRDVGQFRSGHSAWLWLNLIVNAVQAKMSFTVTSDAPPDHHQFKYIRLLKNFPAETIAVGLGVATMRAEFGIPMSACQISLDRLADLIERLGSDSTLWMFDQTDLLGMCGTFAQS
jgi:hypothetical protein